MTVVLYVVKSISCTVSRIQWSWRSDDWMTRMYGVGGGRDLLIGIRGLNWYPARDSGVKDRAIPGPTYVPLPSSWIGILLRIRGLNWHLPRDSGVKFDILYVPPFLLNWITATKCCTFWWPSVRNSMESNLLALIGPWCSDRIYNSSFTLLIIVSLHRLCVSLVSVVKCARISGALYTYLQLLWAYFECLVSSSVWCV